MDVLLEVVAEQDSVLVAQVELLDDFVDELCAFALLAEEHHVAAPAVADDLVGQGPVLSHLDQLVDLLRSHSQQLHLVFVAFLHSLDQILRGELMQQ